MRTVPTLLKVWRAFLSDADLYALAASGLVFTFLGVAGIADTKTLSSVVLALLTLLAFSQARMRRAFSTGPSAPSAAGAFMTGFPAELYQRRAEEGRDYFYVGTSGYRNIGAGLLDLKRMLERGASVRVLLIDYNNEALLQIAVNRSSGRISTKRLRERILASLEELRPLRQVEGLEIRLSASLPTMGVNAFGTRDTSGVIYLQHYEFTPTEEASPIFRLRASDGYWYQHHLAEIERMWTAARPERPVQDI